MTMASQQLQTIPVQVYQTENRVVLAAPMPGLRTSHTIRPWRTMYLCFIKSLCWAQSICLFAKGNARLQTSRRNGDGKWDKENQGCRKAEDIISPKPKRQPVLSQAGVAPRWDFRISFSSQLRVGQ